MLKIFKNAILILKSAEIKFIMHLLFLLILFIQSFLTVKFFKCHSNLNKEWDFLAGKLGSVASYNKKVFQIYIFRSIFWFILYFQWQTYFFSEIGFRFLELVVHRNQDFVSLNSVATCEFADFIKILIYWAFLCDIWL